MLEVTLHGGDNLKQKIQGISMRELGKAVKQCLADAAHLFEREAKRRASGRPGPKVQTGRLRASIRTEIDSATIPSFAKVGAFTKYAAFVEYGHRQRPGRYVPAIQKRLVRSYAPAYPFWRPAWNAVRGQITGVLHKAKIMLEQYWRS